LRLGRGGRCRRSRHAAEAKFGQRQPAGGPGRAGRRADAQPQAATLVDIDRGMRGQGAERSPAAVRKIEHRRRTDREPAFNRQFVGGARDAREQCPDHERGQFHASSM
jgi:hypothetical protein